ncbi:hypothetical protein [Streptomyces sp. NPDC089919]|uniref:hypothetical protein n=1 Tax=Streptomyces sp. NPDC089919 TaxID=3155188 RepID=UPI00342CA66C
MEITWHVIVEETKAESAVVAGGPEGYVQELWTLSVSEVVDGGAEQARALAEELALTYVPEWMSYGDRAGAAPQRTAYLEEGGGWLVSLKHHRGLDRAHLRISAARRMHHEAEALPPRSRFL